MNDSGSKWSACSIDVYARDCALALLVMGLVYLAAGEDGLVILVYGYSLGVVLLLLLTVAVGNIDFDDDDYFG